MEHQYRVGFLGLGAVAIAVAAPHLEVVPSAIAELRSASRGALTSTVQNHQRQRELMLNRELDVGAGGWLQVNVPDADVEVRAGSDDQALVRVFLSAQDMDWGHEVFERMDFSVQLAGDEIRVDARDPRIRRSEWPDRRRGVGMLVEITVPQRFNADIRTADGDIDLGSLEGVIRLETSDGDIYTGNLSGSEIWLETSDGDVNVESLVGERITIHTSDGNVHAETLAGAARVTTGDGDIRLRIEEAGDVNLRTGDGNITIFADPSIRADLDLSGDAVRIDSGFNLDGRIARRGARGRLNGGGPLLQAHTGDGSITIRRGTRDR